MRIKNVVTIGGGTGSFTLLSGLKKYPINISAIVSMADDGGSTGILRDELGVLPPGDARQCLVALSQSSDLMRELMDYRFENGGLKGHNFGNLLLSALEKIRGSFSEGVMEAAKILNVKGEVLPVTNENMRLVIHLKNGETLVGERFLDYHKKIRRFGINKISLEKKTRACKETLERIEKADFIIIGPGDHYGSITPNLLVGGMAKAINQSKAKVIYNCNLTNKKGQTDEYDLDKYAEDINRYIGKDRIDFVVFNTMRPEEDLMNNYEKLEGKGSIVVLNENRKRNFEIIKADLIRDERVDISEQDMLSRKHSFIRHDSEKLARVLMDIMK